MLPTVFFKEAVDWKFSSREDVIGFFITNHSVLLLTSYAIYISEEKSEDDIIKWWEITKVSYEMNISCFQFRRKEF